MKRLFTNALCLVPSPCSAAHAGGGAPRRPRRRPTSTTTSPPATTRPPAPGKPLAPRLQNLGVHTFPVTTTSERAQLFINQGLNLAYGFNHAEAARAFAEAARLDPGRRDGVLGPGARARAEHQRDDERGGRAEGARAGAEGGRAEGERHAARARLHRRAGRALHRQGRGSRKAPTAPSPTRCARSSRRFPDDLDARTLYAEALMDLRPWNYWTRDGVPYDETREIQASLERVLAKQPEPSRARCTCGFICGRRPTRPSAPRRRPIACCR